VWQIFDRSGMKEYSWTAACRVPEDERKCNGPYARRKIQVNGQRLGSQSRTWRLASRLGRYRNSEVYGPNRSLFSELEIREVITALRYTASVTTFQTQQVLSSIEMRRPGGLGVCDIDHSSCRSGKT
jgi:hypothetical protein